MASTPELPRGERLAEVAVDAPAGPGPRTYTYLVPPALVDLEPGEVVLVPFGRGGRQAIGVVVGPGEQPSTGELRPIAARVRSDGPLLPPLTLALARLLADRYLAPLATVIRAMLPPGMLERVELVAEVTPAGEARIGAAEPALAVADLDLLDELAGRARPVRDMATPEGRAALLRRLRALADEGLVELTWTLLGAAIGPRYERRVWITPEGRAAARSLAAGGRPAGRPLGPRQRAALDGAGDRLRDRHGGPGRRPGRRRSGGVRSRRAPRRVGSGRPRPPWPGPCRSP